MVASSWAAGLTAGAMLLAPASAAAIGERDAKLTYKSHAIAAIQTLQSTWWSSAEGVWQETWWNSGNCLNTLALFAKGARTEATAMNIIDGVFLDSCNNAQRQIVTKALKLKATLTMPPIDARLPESRANGTELDSRYWGGFGGFLNDYYDDEGWWALALIAAYDVNADPGFLTMVSRVIFQDMKRGTDSTCGGGIWWSKSRDYKNAIANELYIYVGASIANRVPTNKKSEYLDAAVAGWNWFKNSGMINSGYLINDGLSNCANNGAQTWSYNQGVILGALVELFKATGDNTYLDEAHTLASASLSALTDSNGVIQEMPCGGLVCAQFKGIYIRNLAYLYLTSPRVDYANAIIKSADSVWAAARDGNTGQLGNSWTGPVDSGGGPDSTTHCSALDALVAAMMIS
ncbi:Six-hairpin glycosidase [Thozetella sp. PMI_491]|nr:Six-hairpin glycosidase [Thozetella sp. PMI_491]